MRDSHSIQTPTPYDSRAVWRHGGLGTIILMIFEDPSGGVIRDKTFFTYTIDR